MNPHAVPSVCALTLLVSLGSCEPDRTIPPAGGELLTRLEAYQTLAEEHRLVLAPLDEPGDRLVVLGRLLDRETGEALGGLTVTAYQADDTGSYDEETPGVESSARLRGTVTTDSLGRFLLSTIVPGDYGSTDDNRHIHLAIPAAQPEAYDYYFQQYANWGLRRWARGSTQAAMVELRRGPNGLLADGDVLVRGVAGGGG